MPPVFNGTAKILIGYTENIIEKVTQLRLKNKLMLKKHVYFIYFLSCFQLFISILKALH